MKDSKTVARLSLFSTASVALVYLSLLCHGEKPRRQRVVPLFEIEDLNLWLERVEESEQDFSKDRELGIGGYRPSPHRKTSKWGKNDEIDDHEEKKTSKQDKTFNYSKLRDIDGVQIGFSMSMDFCMSITPPRPTGPAPTNAPAPTGPTPTEAPAPIPTGPSPTDAPGPLPTEGGSCESLTREAALLESLSLVTDPSFLNDPGSSQGMAAQWLLNTDPAQVDPCTYSTILQRYALTTMYFSTNGDEWVDTTGWLTGTNECTWFGVSCSSDLTTEITLVANGLSGVLEEEIKVFESLESFMIGNNAVGGTIPDILTSLSNLKVFDIEINNFSGLAVVHLGGMPKLESYRVSANRLTGTISESIQEVSTLRELWMADNQVVGTIPTSIGLLSNLETFYLYRNAISGTMPTEVGALAALTELQVFQNFLSGPVPEELYQNTALDLLRLDRNRFSGTLSENIGSLTSLADLRIDENLFTGTLPVSLINLSNLVVLRVNDNAFTGTIRDGFNQFSSLDFADFRNNRFSGSLPSTIFDIPTIRILYFSNNALDGPIPPNYGNSPVLRDLFLSSNQLTGTVPEIAVGQLQELDEFLLENNQLTGTMAESICNLRIEGQGMLEDLWVDCGPSADPRMECDAPACCTACFPDAV